MATQRPALRGLLIDISGTLLVGSTPTPRAIDAFRRLQAAGVPYRLCSNTSKESTFDMSQRLHRLGFDVCEGSSGQGNGSREVWTSIGAAHRVMADMGIRRPYLLLSDSARGELQSSVLQESSLGEDHIPFDAVVVGLCPERLDYAHLNTAFRILAREHPAPAARQPVLIALHTGRFLEATSGGLALGPGPFVAALEHALAGIEAGPNVKSHVVGKPSRTFFEAVIGDIDTYGCVSGRPHSTPGDGRIAIIGDDVEADLGGGAVELGLWRVLVRTGKYRAGDERRGTVPPDEVVDSFAAFVESLLDERGGDGLLSALDAADETTRAASDTNRAVADNHFNMSGSNP
ncbi:HAD-like domain-containing protein [Mycena crocata]|nr:HAD-like domain-containing protein [Mycena crocata]